MSGTQLRDKAPETPYAAILQHVAHLALFQATHLCLSSPENSVGEVNAMQETGAGQEKVVHLNQSTSTQKLLLNSNMWCP